MRTVQTTMRVMPDGSVRLADDAGLTPGDHKVVLTLLDDEQRSPQTMTVDEFLDAVAVDVGPWPADLSLRRDALYGDQGR